MANENKLTGRSIMRAIDEFWGEYWPVGKVARIEVYEGSMLDEVHAYDAQGALIESIFHDEGKPYLIRKNEYDLPDCLAERVSFDIESGESTTWTYRAEPATNHLVATVHSSVTRRKDSFDIYAVDNNARIVSCDHGRISKDEGDRWLAKRDSEGRIRELSCQNIIGTTTIAWNYEFGKLDEPIKVVQYAADGRLVSERNYLHEYDAAGNWIRKLETITEHTVAGLFERDRREKIRKLEYKAW